MAKEKPTPAPSNIALPDQQGARFKTYHVEREVMIYPIDETGMKMLSLLNNLVTAFFSVAAALATKALDVLLFSQSATQPVTDGMKALGWICAIGAMFFVGAGICSYRARNSEIERIKRESKVSTAAS